jgi:hypothetical protein
MWQEAAGTGNPTMAPLAPHEAALKLAADASTRDARDAFDEGRYGDVTGPTHREFNRCFIMRDAMIRLMPGRIQKRAGHTGRYGTC